MFTERWIEDLLIYLYVLSLLFAFSYLVRANQLGERLAFLLLLSIWGMQTIDLSIKMVEGFDPLFFYTWILMSFALVVHRFYGMDVFVFCIYVMGFIVLAIHTFFIPGLEQVQEQMVLSELILIHVTLAWSAYAAFSLSGIGAILYLINNHLLKRKKWNRLLKGLPSLGRLRSFSGWLIIVGVLLLSVSMILGVIWGVQTLNYPVYLDIKIWSSALMLVVYSLVLYQWASQNWHGPLLAWWNIGAMGLMVLNYLISNSGLSFHHWF